MLYDKLPVIFLSALASEKGDSINSQIAAYILGHAQQVRGMGIRQLAAECHVGIGTVSRFCREIGLGSYARLQQLLQEYHPAFERLEDGHGTTLSGRIGDEMNLAARTVRMDEVRAVAAEIRDYQRVAAFGLMKAESAAICLQSDLLMLGKNIYTNVSYPQQLEYIRSAGKDTLILLFSYTGAYFDYSDEQADEETLYPPQIVLITGSGEKVPPYIDRVVRFESRQDQLGHPYQLQLVAGLIAQEYARLMEIS